MRVLYTYKFLSECSMKKHMYDHKCMHFIIQNVVMYKTMQK